MSDVPVSAAGPTGRLGEVSESGRRKPRETQTWFAPARFTRLPARGVRARPTLRHRVSHGGNQLVLSVRPREPRGSVLFFVHERQH